MRFWCPRLSARKIVPIVSFLEAGLARFGRFCNLVRQARVQSPGDGAEPITA